MHSNHHPRTGSARLPAFLFALLFAANLATSLPGQSVYLTNGLPKGSLILPPPPEVGSAEAKADLQTVRSVFSGGTEAERARAMKDSGLAFSLFGPAIGPVFQLKKLPRTEALLIQVKKEIGATIDAAKDHWKRRRPYQLDPALSLGQPEPSASYPSGHSTRGTVYSLVLAELFPEQSKPILEKGREIGWDRVLIGKHFPTDVYAGRVLGYAIFQALLANPGFQRDLQAAKAEIAGTRATAQVH